MAKLIPTYSMPTADVRGAFAGYQSAMGNRGKALDSLLDTVKTEVDTADKRAYTKSVSDVLASGDPRKMGTVDFSRLTPEAGQNLQQRMAMAEQAFKLDERDRLLNERKASDIYNEEMVKGRRGLATLTEATRGEDVEKMSYTPEELRVMGTTDVTTKEGLDKLRAAGVDENTLRSIAQKTAAQVQFGKEAQARDVDYESDLQLTRRAVQSARETAGFVPEALQERLRAVEAAAVQSRKEERDRLQKELDNVQKERDKLRLDAAKEQSSVSNSLANSRARAGSGLTKQQSEDFTKVLNFEGDLKKLGERLSPWGTMWIGSTDAGIARSVGRRIANDPNYTVEDAKAALAAGVEFGLDNKFNEDAALRAAAENRLYREAAKGVPTRETDWTYRDALQREAVNLGGREDAIRRRMGMLNLDPDKARLEEARGLGQRAAALVGAPEKAEVKRTVVRSTPVTERAVTPGRQEAVSTEEVGPAEAVRAPQRTSTFNQATAGTEDPESIARDSAPLDALASRVRDMWNQWRSGRNTAGRQGMELGPTLEENAARFDREEVQRLINNVQGKRSGLLDYPSQDEVREARTKLRELYLLNPSRFRELYGEDIVKAVYR